MNKAQMYHDMTTDELKAKFLNLKNELFNLRFQHSTGQLKNPLSLNSVKKDIARVLTILKEREAALPRNKGKVIVKSKTPAKAEAKAEEKPKAPVKATGAKGGSK